MNNDLDKMSDAFKRLIHSLTAGNNLPSDYAGVLLFRSEVHILEIIGKNPGITSSAITTKMNVTKGAVSQITSKLFNKNLIKKTPSSHDAKTLELNLTIKGKDVFDFHKIKENTLKNKILTETGNLKPEDIKRLTSIIDIMTDFINE
ncbi:MAG TPA: MarR family transcriptional regulator [Spirochaetota bacterium]|nr:MarR family transcriptional regulator [Spirochaetota bacterium]HOR45028.1 MarR family transcriptional regulator [Spirochaetota bacterium]HOU84356.1 MarR family transcriptional regulator [Spirochaetota bacterium]HPK56546.1 MarR family transcriptional regulator [Spirochaetota bacterium]HQE57938.1 MarR family transcriptional regulator [Spirochaetota bacterium]